MSAKTVIRPTHQKWLCTLIEKYGADCLIAEIKKAQRTKGRVGHPSDPPNAHRLEGILFVSAVHLAKTRHGVSEQEAVQIVAKKLGLTSDTAKRYFRSWKADWWNWHQSRDANLQTVWPNPQRDSRVRSRIEQLMRML